MNLAADLEEAIKTLTATLEHIQVADGFKEVLTDAHSMRYIVQHSPCLPALQTTSLKQLRTLMAEWVQPHRITLIIVVKAFFGGKEFDEAKSAIDDAANKYRDSMGFLTATMTAELLHHDKDERRDKILTLLWTGDYWKRHQLRGTHRVTNTGVWFLECEPYQNWKSGSGSSVLISLGIRMIPLLSC